MGMNEKVAPTPYIVFVLAGVLPWTLFESAVTASSGSVVANGEHHPQGLFPTADRAASPRPVHH